MAIVEITGGTAEFRDAPSNRDKMALKYALADFRLALADKYDGDIAEMVAGDGKLRSDGELLRAMDTFGMTGLVTLCTGWTCPEPMPRTQDEWLDMTDPPDCSDLLQEMLNKATPLTYAAINSGAVLTSPETVRDPESPTEPSSDSRPGGRAQKTPSTTLPIG